MLKHIFRSKHFFTHCTVKKVSDFPVPNQDVINETLPGGEYLLIPGQGEFGYSRLATGKSLIFFTV